nr:putative RNA-dependent RNA polymerase [Talaya insect virus 2]
MSKNRKQAFARLPDDLGCLFSLLPARKDKWAEEVCSLYEIPTSKVFCELHRHTISYDAVLQDLRIYDRESQTCNRNDAYFRVLNSFRKDLEHSTIVPCTMGAIPQGPDFPDQRSPNLLYKLLGYSIQQEVHARLLHEINQDWQDVEFKKCKVEFPDACLLARAQIARIGRKEIQATWGYPLLLEEWRFFYPIQDAIKARRHCCPIAYGYEMADGGVDSINELLGRYPDSRYLFVDWKQFDQSIPSWFIRDVFLLLAEKLDLVHVQDLENMIWPIAPEPSKHCWKHMVDYFISTPIGTCKGEKLVLQGIPSGPRLNMIEILTCALCIRYSIFQMTSSFSMGAVYLGDDGFVLVDSIVNLEDMATKARFSFKNQGFLIASFVLLEHTRKDALYACITGLGRLQSGFDVVYAGAWHHGILALAAKNELSFRSIALQREYLMPISLTSNTLSLPALNENGLILDVQIAEFTGNAS